MKERLLIIKKWAYKLISNIPIIGTNLCLLMIPSPCSPMLETIFEPNMVKRINEWQISHPDEIVTNSVIKRLAQK